MWEVVRAKQKEFYFSNMGETALVGLKKSPEEH